MTLSDYSRAYAATMRETQKPDPQLTFKSWQRDMAGTRGALLLVRRMYENDKVKILSDCSSTKAAELLAEAQEQLLAIRRKAQTNLKDRLDAVVASKREQLSKASGAPSEADLRLLTALSLRSELTDTDVIHAAEQMSDSLVALGTLADIAESRGVDIPIPTADRLESQLADAVRFSEGMLDYIDQPSEALPYKALCFYDYVDIPDGPAVAAFGELDRSAFTAVGQSEG